MNRKSKIVTIPYHEMILHTIAGKQLHVRSEMLHTRARRLKKRVFISMPEMTTAITSGTLVG